MVTKRAWNQSLLAMPPKASLYLAVNSNVKKSSMYSFQFNCFAEQCTANLQNFNQLFLRVKTIWISRNHCFWIGLKSLLLLQNLKSNSIKFAFNSTFAGYFQRLSDVNLAAIYNTVWMSSSSSFFLSYSSSFSFESVWQFSLSRFYLYTLQFNFTFSSQLNWRLALPYIKINKWLCRFHVCSFFSTNVWALCVKITYICQPILMPSIRALA